MKAGTDLLFEFGVSLLFLMTGGVESMGNVFMFFSPSDEPYILLMLNVFSYLINVCKSECENPGAVPVHAHVNVCAVLYSHQRTFVLEVMGRHCG